MARSPRLWALSPGRAGWRGGRGERCEQVTGLVEHQELEGAVPVDVGEQGGGLDPATELGEGAYPPSARRATRSPRRCRDGLVGPVVAEIGDPAEDDTRPSTAPERRRLSPTPSRPSCFFFPRPTRPWGDEHARLATAAWGSRQALDAAASAAGPCPGGGARSRRRGRRVAVGPGGENLGRPCDRSPRSPAGVIPESCTTCHRTNPHGRGGREHAVAAARHQVGPGRRRRIAMPPPR
jgi:hypothetical protein